MSDSIARRRKVGRPEIPLVDKFNAHVDTRGEDECWEWDGNRDRDGYGITNYKRKRVRAHRVSWMLSRGEIPAGMCVCHRCDNPACVNPHHLFIGTIADNNHDRHRKMRDARMELASGAKLTRADVLEIIKMRRSGTIYRVIGERFGVSWSAARNVVIGATWAGVKERM